MYFLQIHPPLPAVADPLGVSGIDPSISQVGDLAALATKITGFALSFVGIIALIMVIWGGFLYLTSSGNEEQAKKGMHTILYALVGIVLISLAYVIVNAITSTADSGWLNS